MVRDMTIRRSPGHAVGLLLCWCISGCGNVDWNWDPAWWREPTRVVRPAHSKDASREEPVAAATNSPTDKPKDRAPVPEARPAPTLSEDTGQPKQHAAPPASPQYVQATPKDRPFYQLYLMSKTRKGQQGRHRGDRVLRLEQAGARSCANLLEWLYVPVGRSGSPDECYLLYENAAEFEAAAKSAPILDVASTAEAPSPVGAEASFRAGIGMLLHISEQGAIVDPDRVTACERHLASAAQSRELPAPLRWTAGILAGRLVASYRYDFASARSYYRQAERAAESGSLEEMTARWWYADALTREGETRSARAAYDAILTEYGAKWPRAHITQRAGARLAHRPKGR